MKFAADFEATTDENDCRVWAWGLSEIGMPENFHYGNSINTFFNWFIEAKENYDIYFHNLGYDGIFILVWLFKNGFKHVRDKKDLGSKTFTTLISDKGQFFTFTIVFKKEGKKTQKLTIYDSLKILPFSVKAVAKSFGLELKKGKIDYNKYREEGHEIDEEELSYLKNDCMIMSMALHITFMQGLTRMTTASNALNDLKETIGKKKFDKWFPPPAYDYDIRPSYKGGWIYLKSEYADKDIDEGIVLDVNGLYPYVMASKPLPYGNGIWYIGEYKQDDLYPLFIQTFKCHFKLKEKHLPTIQLKNNLAFMPTEYLTSSNGEDVILCLTSVDYELFFNHYNVYNIEYISGWKFKSAIGLISPYIYKWAEIKAKSKEEGNKGKYTTSKLMQNGVYGKFSTNPKVRSKIPFYDDGFIRFKMSEEENREPVYLPMGTFITSWARYITITSAQKVYNRFIYAHTDSMHLKGTDIPEGLEIHDLELGKWKHESTYLKARHLRQNSYIEIEIISDKDYNKLEDEEKQLCYMINGTRVKDKITVAGMPESCYENVTWENFHVGTKYPGKLQKKIVRDGIILKNIDFSIKK